MQRGVKILVLMVLPAVLVAQGITTSDDAVQAALANHPLVKAAAYTVQAKKYSEKTALNLPNPDLITESPTGEFYAIGVSQSFEFPTVYKHQKQVAKAETALAEANQRISENDLRYTIRQLYLDAQLATFEQILSAQNDSIFQLLANTAKRQFDAGDIDFLEKTRVEQAAGKAHQTNISAAQHTAALKNQLATWTALTNLSNFTPLQPDTLVLNAAPTEKENPQVTYAAQAATVAERQTALAKSKGLPTFTIGYLNQGPRNTPVPYRLRAGIGVPLWYGQYNNAQKSAENEVNAAQNRLEAAVRTVALERAQLESEMAIALAQIRYYEKEALPGNTVVATTALRMREAGQMDYSAYLRVLDDVYQVKKAYAEQVYAFNTGLIKLRYLAGD
jgi:outer membrane protein TolC